MAFPKHNIMFNGTNREKSPTRKKRKRRQRSWMEGFVPRNNRERSWARQGIRLTIEEYDALFDAQGGACKLCFRFALPNRHFNVDHDHSDGRIRGLLCAFCNRHLRVCKWVRHGWLDRARAHCGYAHRED